MNLTDIKRQAVEKVVKDLRADSRGVSTEAGLTLVAKAKDAGLGLKDYLTLAVDPRQGDNAAQYAGLNGYEASLAHLNLPFQNDLSQGVLLQAASDTFQKYPGTRAMFPLVVDEMLRWTNRQDQLEKVKPLLSQSRTINGTEMISTIVLDDSKDRDTFTVPELSRIPVRTIRTGESTVKMFKHGSAYRTSYEFNRRASLDILTPYAARIAREMEISKVKSAVSVLINGDGVNPAATAQAISTYGADLTGGKTLQSNYKALAKFLMARAAAGNPVDVLAGNYDMFVEMIFMFSQTLTSPKSVIGKLKEAGTPAINLQLPIMNGAVDFVLASSVPAGKLIAFNRAETLEELVEAGSSISENERSIENQAITYVRTEATGYKLALGDTRTILDTLA